MTDVTRNPADAAAAARRLLEAQVNERVEAVRVVVSAANDAEDAERVAQEARERHTRAWDAALRAGWTEKDLKQTGAKQPGTAAPKRRARRTSTATANAAEQGAQSGDDNG